MEEEVEIQGKPYYVGHSREYVKVAVGKQDAYGVNDIVNVEADCYLCTIYNNVLSKRIRKIRKTTTNCK